MRIIAIAICMLISTAAFSQSEEVKLIQSLYGMEKKAILNEYLKFSDDASQTTFWELYDAYEEQRKTLGETRVRLLNKYVNDYMNMSEEEMGSLLTDVTKMNSDYVKLLNSYIKKINKKVGVKQAAQFYQIENYLNNAINVSIAEQIPFIGELD